MTGYNGKSIFVRALLKIVTLSLKNVYFAL